MYLGFRYFYLSSSSDGPTVTYTFIGFYSTYYSDSLSSSITYFSENDLNTLKKLSFVLNSFQSYFFNFTNSNVFYAILSVIFGQELIVDSAWNH